MLPLPALPAADARAATLVVALGTVLGTFFLSEAGNAIVLQAMLGLKQRFVGYGLHVWVPAFAAVVLLAFIVCQTRALSSLAHRAVAHRALSEQHIADVFRAIRILNRALALYYYGMAALLAWMFLVDFLGLLSSGRADSRPFVVVLAGMAATLMVVGSPLGNVVLPRLPGVVRDQLVGDTTGAAFKVFRTRPWSYVEGGWGMKDCAVLLAFIALRASAALDQVDPELGLESLPDWDVAPPRNLAIPYCTDTGLCIKPEEDTR